MSFQRNESCDKCPLHKSAKSVCIPPTGKVPSKHRVMVIGEYPGPDEDSYGVPFIGRAGGVLNAQLTKLGLTREEVYVTNAVKCYPGEIRKPTSEEYETCTTAYLRQEIEDVAPNVIIPLGSTAFQALHGRKKVAFSITEISGIGRQITTDLYKGWVVPVIHPAATLHNQGYIKKFIDGMTAAFSFAKKMEETATNDFDASVDPPESVDLIANSPAVVYDTETTGLDPMEPGAQMRCIQFGTLAGDDVYLINRDMERFWHIITNPKILKIGHNVRFDVRWPFVHLSPRPYDLESLRTGIGPFFDTQLAHHLLDETTEHGLKKLAWSFTEHGGYEPDGNPAEWPDDKLYPYAKMDVVVTRKIARRFMERIESRGFSNLFRLIMDVLPVITYMEVRGIGIDVVRAVSQVQALQQRSEEITTEFKIYLRKKFGIQPWIDNFNPNSPQQVAGLLYNRLGAPLGRDNKPTADAATLEKFAPIYKEAEYILDFRSVASTASKITSMVRHTRESIDNQLVVSTDYTLDVTRTGRLSSREPNLQNIPRDDSESALKIVKSIFVPRPGYTFVECDFSQAELRIAAWFANDDAMIRLFQDRHMDFHQGTAELVFPKPHDAAEKKLFRQRAKATNFAVLYGASAYRVSKQIGSTVPYADELIRRYFRNFKGLAKWIADTKEFAIKNGYVVSPFGRKRRLSNVRSLERKLKEHALREATNAPIQGAASDLTLMCLIKTTKEVPEAKPVLTIHDSIVFEVPVGQRTKIALRLKACMEDARTAIKQRFGLDAPVPFFVDVKIGKQWGSAMKKLEEK